MAREKKEKPLSERKLKFALLIADKLLGIQRLWANIMNRWFSKLTIPAQKRILVIVTSLGFVSCAALVFRPFVRSSREQVNNIAPDVLHPGRSGTVDKNGAAGKKPGLGVPNRTDSLTNKSN